MTEQEWPILRAQPRTFFKAPRCAGVARLAVLACSLTLLLTACAVTMPQDNFSSLNPLSTSEKEALVAFYHSAGGPEWLFNSGWLEGDPIGDEVKDPEVGIAFLENDVVWYGVQVGSHTRVSFSPSGGSGTSYQVPYVQALLLERNNLTGEISSKLHGLDKLQFLDLQGNRLTGEIPSELGQMDDLLLLNLSGNRLAGEIPPELADIELLGSLNLANNRLTGEIPAKLGDLGPQLQALILRGNQLTGEIPPELGDIRDLSALNLRSNNLTGEIPPELGRFRQLHWLYLGDNQFTGCIPSSLARIPNNDILLLDLPMCDTGALPGDEITRPLITLFKSTGGFDWHDNTNWGSNGQTSRWHGVSNRGARGPRLVTILELPENNLTGEIPPELGSLGTLRSLDLSGNNLTGQIPAELDNLDRLVVLRLGGNRFTGCIPPNLRFVSINDLSELDLPFCAGEALPPEETNPALLALYNGTDGDNWHDNTWWLTKQPLGEWFGVHTPSRGPNPRPVEKLRLSKNNLTGPIPPGLGNLESLEVLSLDGNNLTGQIPPELGNAGRLLVLNLSGNNLTGQIPPELGSLGTLRSLNLSGNNLTGQIPPELGNAGRLVGLNLSGNNLTGDIPPELARLSRPGGITVLRLKGNRFTGCIPAKLKRVEKNDLSELGLPFCPR